MKKTTLIICLVMLFTVTSVHAYAATNPENHPMYTYISSVSAGLSIDETTGIAGCSGSVESSRTMPVEILVQLQVYKDGAWKTLMSWSNTGTMNASVNRYYTVESGYQYRVKATGYVCNDLGLPVESAVAEKYVTYPSN